MERPIAMFGRKFPAQLNIWLSEEIKARLVNLRAKHKVNVAAEAREAIIELVERLEAKFEKASDEAAQS